MADGAVPIAFGGTPAQRMEVVSALSRKGWHKSPTALDVALRFVLSGEGPDGQARRLEMLKAAVPYWERVGFDDAMRAAYRMADYVERGGAP